MYRLEHRVGVAAPAEDIWEHLSNLESWSAWNPLYPRAAGKLGIGQVLDIDETIPGLPSRTITPTVLDWVPYEQIHWALKADRTFPRSVRFIEIESLGPANCIVSNGEVWFGRFGGFGEGAVHKRRKAILAGFSAMNEALKARAETR